MSGARAIALLLSGAAIAGLAACGSRTELRYPTNEPGPARPRGENAPPDPEKLLQPETQARPSRDDEVLRRSEERDGDPFELPPEG